MNLIVTALKQKLAPFGWTETVRRGGDARGYAVSTVSREGEKAVLLGKPFDRPS